VVELLVFIALLFVFEVLPVVGAAELVVAVFGRLALSAEQPVQKAATASKADRAKILRIIFSPLRSRGSIS
jgi:hypothetical protein